MDTTDIHDLLVARLGYDAGLVGPSFLPSAVRHCIEEAGIASVDEYVRAVTAGGEAWEALVERVVVAETWFFRDRTPFDLVVDVARTRWRGPEDRPVRILSCPCSTGEEPYSAAIALIDAGFPAEAFSICGADVSRRALAYAGRGEFHARSFRGLEGRDYARHFDQEERSRSWRIKPALRSLVSFRQANMVSGEGLHHDAPYDIVLCRNLLIYLHDDGRARAMAMLRSLLADEGVLIVGHAEPAIAREHGFLTTGDPAAFAFVKHREAHGARASARASTAARSGRERASTAPVGPQRPSAARAPHGSDVRPAPASSPDTLPSLDRVRELGDHGSTEAAIELCHAYVGRVRDSAEGHFLLGVLYDAQGQGELAVQAFRRAIYLDPQHKDALLHLALKQEAGGDAAGAARLRAKVARAEQSGVTDR